jgi:hypothetical protein
MQVLLKFISLLFLCAGISMNCLPQPYEYDKIFGSDWNKALQFVEENDNWIRPVLEKYDIPYHVAVAVVFPELVRYSALRDKMETTMLKTLYRNLGDDYADFSIGVFQVKPSFAEKLREEAGSLPGWRLKTMFKKTSSFKNVREYRGDIVSDLEDPQKEFKYIVAFFKICEKYFPEAFADEETKIKFLATAYNSGFWKTKEEIGKMSSAKFYNTKLFSTENYSYADVSLFWYKQYIQK